jgi:putative ATP-binding cassette transporter
MSQVITPLPLVVQAPRLFAGQITFGDVTQSSSAFLNIHDSLAFFRSVYDSFAAYRATIIRLEGLVDANAQARALPRLAAEETTDGTVELRDVDVRRPNGELLIDGLDLRLKPGEALVITGPSGCGRTTLLRSIARLWPYGSGTVRQPGGGDGKAMFLSQVPYVPLGDLRAVLTYPAVEASIPDEKLVAALDDVALGHLNGRLNEVKDWAKVLSPGEQQRIAFARVLLTRPAVVFLDEATAAVDEGQEYSLYRLLRTRLPDCIVVSVTHRSTVEQHHDHHLRLLGGGEWRLARRPEAVGV